MSKLKFSIDDVRNYLVNTNAVEEAESYIFKGNYAREELSLDALTFDAKKGNTNFESVHSDIKKRLQKNGLSSTQEKRDKVLEELLASKHEGYLSLLKEEQEMHELQELEIQLRKESSTLEAERRAIAVKLRTQKKTQLIELEEESKMELLDLEKKRHIMETQLNIRKSTIEKLQNDLREAETANEELFSKNIDAGPIIDPAVIQANNHITEVSVLALNHATKLAEIKIAKDNAILELNKIQNKTWKVDTSNVLNNGKNLPIIDNFIDKNKSSTLLTTDATELINSFSKGSQNKRLEILKSQLIEENLSSKIDDILASVNNNKNNDVDTMKINDMLSKFDYTGDSSNSMGANLDKWLNVVTDNSVLSPPANTNNSNSNISSKSSNNINTNTFSAKKTTFNDILKKDSIKDSIKDNEKDNIMGNNSNKKLDNNTKEVNNDISSVQHRNNHDHIVDTDMESEAKKQIRQLQEELNQLKEMKMNSNIKHNSQNEQFSHVQHDPYNQNSYHPSQNLNSNNQFHHPQQQPYQQYSNPHQQYGFNPHHNPYNLYAQQQHPFYPPQHYQQLPPPQQQYQTDPAQALMLQQLQKMSEQIEKENMKLMEQLGDLDGGNNSRNNGRNNDRSRFNNNRDNRDNNNNNRDNNNNNNNNNNDRDKEMTKESQQKEVTVISKLEAKHQEEIRLMQLEMERLKNATELDELKAGLEKRKEMRIREDENARILDEQKQQLQQIKMKQAIAKEEKLLKLQMGITESYVQKFNGESGGGGGDGDTKDTVAADKARQYAILMREDSGVGSIPLSVDLCKGIVTMVDGLLIAKEFHQANSFRLAVGVYDASGKSVARLTASEWQPWSIAKNENDTLNSIQFLNSGVKRIVKQTDNELGVGFKCMIEIQTKSDAGNAIKSVGFAIMSVTVIENDDNKLFLKNGMWKLAIRKGIADPLCDPMVLSSEENIVGFVLLRVGDYSDAVRVSSWSPKGQLIKSLDVSSVYFNPLNSSENKTFNNPVSTENVLNNSIPLEKVVDNNSVKPLINSRPPTANSIASAIKSPIKPPTKPSTAISRPTTSQSQIDIKSHANIKSESKVVNTLTITDETSEKEAEEIEKKRIADQLVEDSINEVTAINQSSVSDDKVPWLLGTPTGPATERYQRGDGIDIYIDSAMYLPDNCTVSRVDFKVMTADKEKISSTYNGYSLLQSSAISPEFNLKAEIQPTSLDPTAIAIIRIDTIDCRTLLPTSIGYSVIKILSTKDRKQPKSTDSTKLYINSGSFQLPIYGGRIPASDTFTDKMLDDMCKIPCATLLVRILAGVKSSDGMSVLSRADFPKEDWLRLGLSVNPPPYMSGDYNGALCEPSSLEAISYNVKALPAAETCDVAITQAMAIKTSHGLTPKINSDSTPEEQEEWMKSLFPEQMRNVMDFSYSLPYSIDAGISIQIDALYNVPDSNGFFSSSGLLYKVIYSITPPGLFYKDPPLTEGVKYTKINDFDTASKAPGFSDGFVDLQPSRMEEHLYLILDVRRVIIEKGKNGEDIPNITIEPTIARKSYWSILPLAMERIQGKGFLYSSSGIFQVPLFEGAVPIDDILRTSNPLKEILTRLESKDKKIGSSVKLSDGASILVRVCNPLLRPILSGLIEDKISPKNLNTDILHKVIKAANQGITPIKLEKFTFDIIRFNVLKSTTGLMPVDCKKVQKIINKSFAAAVGMS